MYTVSNKPLSCSSLFLLGHTHILPFVFYIPPLSPSQPESV